VATTDDVEPIPWGDDAPLVALLGPQGAEAFCQMFDGFPEAVGLLWAIRDEAGRIVDFDFGYGNPAILRMFRLPGSQTGRYTVLEALPAMREDGTFDRYAEVCDTGEPLIDEVSFDTPFGDGYIRGTFLRRTAKLGDGLIVLMTDVTEQRRMEAELRGFADMVAHDLREPVTGIAHLVTLLERRARTPPDPQVLGLLRASTERARELIDGVLAYARRLMQNLISNAVKFRADAPPRVEVSAAPGAGGWVVTVRDNGLGVSPADSRRIFGMFARAHPEQEGTGIGLAVCRRVVEAHGGRIWVEPAEGGGSAFRFTLPAHADAV
jgi:signal transduction histidine kinase